MTNCCKHFGAPIGNELQLYIAQYPKFTPRMRKLLEILARRQGHIFAYATIIDHVWGHDADGGPEDPVRNLHVMKSQKIGVLKVAGLRIETMHGSGFLIANGEVVTVLAGCTIPQHGFLVRLMASTAGGCYVKR